MAITRKNPLPLTLPIPHSLVCAIGHVVTQWAYFEKEIDEEIKQLDKLPACENVKRPEKNTEETMLKRWRDLSLSGYTETLHRLMVRQIYDRAHKLLPYRNKVVHGRWAGKARTLTQLFERRGEIISITDAKEASAATREMECFARQIADMNVMHLNLQARTLNIREPSWDVE
jgi:hypothetical protein